MSTYLDQGINKVKFKMARNEKPKNYMGFHIHKIWQILKHKKFRFQKGFLLYYHQIKKNRVSPVVLIK